MKKIILSVLFISSISSVCAENIINTQTNTWKSVPITVDEDNKTYTTQKGYLMPEGNYYYTFSGYRCLMNKTEGGGEEPLVLKPVNTGDKEIYCYKADQFVLNDWSMGQSFLEHLCQRENLIANLND